MNINDFQMPDWNQYNGEPKFFVVFNRLTGNVVRATWDEGEALKIIKNRNYDYQWFFVKEG